MTFQIELDPKEQAAADLITDVGFKLQNTLSEAKTGRKITQRELADILGIDRSRVNKCFSGYSNLTLKSLAELAWALDKKAIVSICDMDQDVEVCRKTVANYKTTQFVDTDFDKESSEPFQGHKILLFWNKGVGA